LLVSDRQRYVFVSSRFLCSRYELVPRHTSQCGQNGFVRDSLGFNSRGHHVLSLLLVAMLSDGDR
jgi:hypothetical protein